MGEQGGHGQKIFHIEVIPAEDPRAMRIHAFLRHDLEKERIHIGKVFRVWSVWVIPIVAIGWAIFESMELFVLFIGICSTAAWFCLSFGFTCYKHITNSNDLGSGMFYY